MPLPLPAQDRAEIEDKIRRNRHSKLSLLELFLLVSSVCILLGLIRWIPLHLYALGLGILTVLLLIGFFGRMSARYRFASVSILLFFYLLTAIMLVFHNGF